MDQILSVIDPALALKIVAVLGVLSAVKELLNAFGNQENKVVQWTSKILDVLGYNPPHK